MSAATTWEAVFARIRDRPPPKTYGIAFTPRSGSTWITDIVGRTKLLGHPGEYFNINAARPSIHHAACTTMEDYFQWLCRARSSNGVFGFEISAPWLELLRQEEKLDVLGDVDLWFFLRRRDFVLQAVSLYLASSSGVFHLRDESGRGPAQSRVSGDVSYDAEAIFERALHIMHGEFLLARYFRERSMEPELLWYEDLIAAGPQAFLRALAASLGVELAPRDEQCIDAIAPAMKKSGGERNREYAERFRAEYPAFVAHWVQYRGRMGAAAYRAQLRSD